MCCYAVVVFDQLSHFVPLLLFRLVNLSTLGHFSIKNKQKNKVQQETKFPFGYFCLIFLKYVFILVQ